VATKRTYGDGCAAAHALDLVGERWALLIVRELLLGPKRYTDLRAGMPNVSPNVLSQRLHELEETGILVRHRLGPPVSSWVYELTEWGHDLEPVLLYLGRWGRRSTMRDPEAETSTDAIMLAMRAHSDPLALGDLNATYAVHLDDGRFVIRVTAGSLDVTRGETREVDAVVETDPRTFAALVTGRRSWKDAARAGAASATGTTDAVARLFDALGNPKPAPA
jgi:DNA-binding HxlR family transcriptional regulator